MEIHALGEPRQSRSLVIRVEEINRTYLNIALLDSKDICILAINVLWLQCRPVLSFEYVQYDSCVYGLLHGVIMTCFPYSCFIIYCFLIVYLFLFISNLLLAERICFKPL